MSDSFESLLENALSAPDLELGHEMRRRLLAAAAPAAKAAPENIVLFEVLDPDAAAGFDWLVGDAPVTRPLIRRMSRDPGFFALLDDERRFLRSLRRCLRKPAAAVVKRKSHAVVAAAAAALALAAGTLFAFRGAGSATSTSVAMAVPVSQKTSASRSPSVASVPSRGVAAPASHGLLTSAAHSPMHRAGVVSPPVAANFAGDSRAPLNTSDEVTSLVFSLETAAAATFGTPDPAVALLDSNREPSGVLLASQDASWSSSDLSNAGFPAGPDLSFDTEDGRTSIPEPAGMLPVMIGCLVLLLHRPKRRKATA